MCSLSLPARLRVAPVRPGQPEETQRQRADRLREVAKCSGRDQQRLERVKGRTHVVFPERATADEVMLEIAATPIIAAGLNWPVQTWDEDADTAIGTIETPDGRVAVGHHWTTLERRWLTKYVKRWRGAKVLDVCQWIGGPNKMIDQSVAGEAGGQIVPATTKRR